MGQRKGAAPQREFLSTPSARRATMERGSGRLWVFISIHALREEGDQTKYTVNPKPKDFYPRPPRGGRHVIPAGESLDREFLSTPSARRATDGGTASAMQGQISIHALREEGDDGWASDNCSRRYFYPRPPRGGRQQKQRKNPCFYSIINHSAQNGKNCNCAEHERCVFCGKNIRFSGAKKTEKA